MSTPSTQALASALMRSAPQQAQPQQVAQLTLGPAQKIGGGGLSQVIIDPTGAVVGMYTTNTQTPFSPHKITPFVNGQPNWDAQQSFSSRAKAFGSLGLTK